MEVVSGFISLGLLVVASHEHDPNSLPDDALFLNCPSLEMLAKLASIFLKCIIQGTNKQKITPPQYKRPLSSKVTRLSQIKLLPYFAAWSIKSSHGLP